MMRKRINIRIDGTGTAYNKGSELMLHAILKEIEKEYPDADVCYNYNFFLEYGQSASYFKTSLHLYNSILCKKGFFKILKLLHVPGIISKLFNGYDIVTRVNYLPPINVDVLMDASGFSVSDQFVPHDNKYPLLYEKYYSTLKSNGTKIIFLPQAFGPVESEYTKNKVVIINKYSDLVFARERVSYDYLSKSGLNNEKLKLYPDFTCLIKGIIPLEYTKYKNYVCIIPNNKMIEKGVTTENKYLLFLDVIVNLCLESGKNVLVINHGGPEDNAICSLIADKYKLPVVGDINAIIIKGIISEAYIVISSRFHGVASALSSCVPCLATSWSHKYQLLFEDYKQEDCLLDINDLALCKDRANYVLDIENNQNIRNRLVVELDTNKKKVNEMWKLIWDKIKK
jgi:polysaccharide pyruvyl transferase WcaK-like protein